MICAQTGVRVAAWASLACATPWLASAAPPSAPPPAAGAPALVAAVDLPKVEPELKAAVDKPKKLLRNFAKDCWKRPGERTGDYTPDHCEADKAAVTKLLDSMADRVRIHAIFQHGILPIVLSASDDSSDTDSAWHGGFEMNAETFANSLVTAEDTALVAHYAVASMQRVAAKRRAIGADVERIQYLGQIIERQGLAPASGLPAPWQKVKGSDVLAEANAWKAWFAERAALATADLKVRGAADLQAAFASAELSVFYHAVRAAMAAPRFAAQRPKAIWLTKARFLKDKLSKGQLAAFDEALASVDRLSVLGPPPAGLEPLPALANPLGPVLPLAGEQTPAVAVFAMPSVPAAIRDNVKAVESTLKGVWRHCWAEDYDAVDMEDYGENCERALEAAKLGEGEVDPVVLAHAVGRSIVVPMALGKLKHVPREFERSPLRFVLQRKLPDYSAPLQLYLWHALGLALNDANWTAKEGKLIEEIREVAEAQLRIPNWHEPPFGAVVAATQRDRLRIQRLLALVPADFTAATSEAKFDKWRNKVFRDLSLSRDLAARYRTICGASFYLIERATQAVVIHGQRQVLLDESLPRPVREAFATSACRSLALSELLVPPALPTQAVAAAAPFASATDAPRRRGRCATGRLPARAG